MCLIQKIFYDLFNQSHRQKPNLLSFRLARVGYERIEETEDPELAIDRAMKTYLQKDILKSG